MSFQTFTPIEYLKIDVANNFGHDKLTWDERLDWFKANESNLAGLQDQAAEPALYFAGVNAYYKAKEGRSINYPISLDATASGAQILAALIGCRKSALLCNVLDNGTRMDLYTAIYEIMQGTLAAEEGDDSPIFEGVSITRKDVKSAVMTSLYGSKAQPKKVFGEGDLLHLFYEVMQTAAPGIWQLNEALLALWQPTFSSYDWVLPDNFHVHVKVMDKEYTKSSFLDVDFVTEAWVNRPMDTGLSIGANTVHSIDGMIVREISRRCSYAPDQILNLLEILTSNQPRGCSLHRGKDKLVATLWKHYLASGFLSARILENLDQDNMGLVDEVKIAELIKTLPEKPFPVLAIHDCFRVLANYGNDLRRQYNRLLSEIAGSNLLTFLASQIVRDTVTATKHGDIADEILESNYALS